MLEKWKASLDKGEYVGVIFMDLSKAFDTINHDLLLAKLKAYGFSHNALAFMLSYLKNRSHRVNINNNFSTWGEIIAGVSQGSILGHLLFNIFINDIFYFKDKSCLSNYADDNVLYAFGSNMTEVKDKLSQDLPKLSEWFTENFMILNPDKCHYMCLGKDAVNDILKLCDVELKSSELETVLGIEIDQKLTFNCHVKTLCSKAAKKLSALQRIDNIIDEEKRNLLFNAIIKSQFSYCPLVWMFCSRRSNNLINNIHERALRATFDDHTSNFTQLLEKKSESTAHQQNIQALKKEIYRFTNNLSPVIIVHMFRENFQQLASSTKKTTKMGLETISYRGQNCGI